MSGLNFAVNSKEAFIENKDKIRTFWDWNRSKIKNIEPHQNFTGSYEKSVILIL